MGLRVSSLFVHMYFSCDSVIGGGVELLDGALELNNVNVNDYKQQRGCDATRRMNAE